VYINNEMQDKIISKKIKEIRNEAGLTQKELAYRVGVGLRFLRELEQGKPTVRMDKVLQVLDFFGYRIGVEKNAGKE
jgi:y4mF family transcriptional regulator